MNIALIGYGKMGKAIEQEAVQRGHRIVLAMDQVNKDLSTDTLKLADVAVEFSRPEAAPANILKCFEAGIPVVVGTTGWYDRYEELKQACTEKKGTLFTATNFSIGVNIFFAVNQFMAKIMNNHPDYKPSITEIHHTQKLDAPSGTAITLAEQTVKNIDALEGWELTYSDEANGNMLPINALRENDVPGIHEITYRSGIDEISLKHTAFSRKGFALGAVVAAEWVAGKKGVFGMEDLLKF